MRFLLVDRIEEIQPGTSIRGFKNVAMSEDYLTWHFPEQPILPGVLILESFAQLAGWLEAKTSDFTQWVLLERVRSARYYHFCVPGDRLTLSLEQLESEDDGRRVYRGECSVDGGRRATVEFEAVVVPMAELEERERAVRTYEALQGSEGLLERMDLKKGPRA
ncbi:MAG: 3-hydroxyacyl-ACP dehydratase FabZ family protein [Planctomycetota bacterium]|nr:3-hydroxyacyl-ACP dehydratase FabZ family protein [Planctomycetota bacterium]